MKEYWNRPDATAETIVDGWLHTGDVAVMDEEGFVTIQDRMKDMIISGGENVYPAEIENVLLQHPGVADAAVIGQDSAKWGESPFAVIVRSDPDLTEAQVLAHCDGKLARFKLPKGAVFIDEIPRNPSGKILKRVLREHFPGPAPE
jgi:acyl-CoA synthetase (AMP-forming)/AMP-acid ligase II